MLRVATGVDELPTELSQPGERYVEDVTRNATHEPDNRTAENPRGRCDARP